MDNATSPKRDPLERIQLRERFILVGQLSAVRVILGSTYVFLRPAAGSDINVVGTSIRNGVQIPTLCDEVAIEFPSSVLAEQLADYRVGDKVSAVVLRKPWDESLNWAKDFAKVVSPDSTTAVTRLCELRDLRTIPAPIYYWCLRGEGLEKQGQKATWIDSRYGRAEKLRNRDSIRQTPGFILRTLPDHLGQTLRIGGNLRGFTRNRESLWASLRVPSSAEGVIPVLVDLGGSVTLDDVAGFHQDDRVVGDLEVHWLNIGQLTSAPRFSESVTASIGGALAHLERDANSTPSLGFASFYKGCVPIPWGLIMGRCLRIQRADTPEVIVTNQGKDRGSGDQVSTADRPGQTSDDTTLGREVSWNGRLIQVLRFRGETHLKVEKDTQVFEAFSKDPEILENLSDYMDSLGPMERFEKVQVSGKLVTASSAAYRLEGDVPLLEIVKLQRDGETDSVVEPGRKRNPSTFRKYRVQGWLKWVRDLPAPGSIVKLKGYYWVYREQERAVEIEENESRHKGIVVNVEFPSSSKEMFKDYKSRDRVEVELRIPNDPPRISRRGSAAISFPGASIVRAVDRESLVTDQGRAVPARDDFEEKRRVRAFMHSERIGEAFQGRCLFDGYLRESALYRVDLTFGRGMLPVKLELLCVANPNAKAYLDTLKKGEDLLVECERIRLGQAFFTGPHGTLRWLARANEPEKKHEFTPQLSQTETVRIRSGADRSRRPRR